MKILSLTPVAGKSSATGSGIAKIRLNATEETRSYENKAVTFDSTTLLSSANITLHILGHRGECRMSRDSAVFPVVGVMLLLDPLVIIFTAVFAAYSGGLSQAQKYAPSVEIVAYTSGSGENFSLLFEHRGGDVLSAVDVKITTFVGSEESSFLISDLTKGSWRPGEILSTKNLTETASHLHISKDQLTQAIKRSAPVENRVYHLPINSIIFKDTILLEEK